VCSSDLANDEFAPAAALELARDQLRAASGVQSGQWAFQQSVNEKSLQGRTVVGSAANVYRDRRGNIVATKRVCNAGKKVFYLRNGQWQDAEEAGDRKVRVVKIYSEAYYSLLRSNKDFAKAQEVGWNVAINVADERIVVEKDGKQRVDEQQQPRQQVTPQSNGRQQLNQLNENQLQQLRGLELVPNRAKQRGH